MEATSCSARRCRLRCFLACLAIASRRRLAVCLRPEPLAGGTNPAVARLTTYGGQSLFEKALKAFGCVTGFEPVLCRIPGPVLYPLSYTFNVTGVEPATSGFLVLRSTTELHVGAANLHRQNPFTEQAIRMSS